MLEQILNLVKENAGDAIINNNSIPNDNNDETIQVASNSISSSLQNMVAEGGIKDLMKMFGNSTQDFQNNAVTQKISGGVIQDLVSKLGVDQQTATGIAGNLIPKVLGNLVQKTNDPADNGFDVQNIFNSLSNGKTSSLNLSGLMDKVKAGTFDLDGDGDTDLQDVMSLVGGNTGGIMDKVKGMFS